MIEYGVDINKTNASNECNVCHYWYFLHKTFNYEPYLWNGSHDLIQKCKKMSEATYYERNREVMLNRADEYYENNKEVLRENAKNRYRELSEEEKNIKRVYEGNKHHNMPEEKKQRLKEY